MKNILLLLLLIVVASSIDILVNNQTLIDQQPKLIASVKNGQKLLIGDLNDPNKNILYIANLKGTPYQMGVAYGELFKEQLKDNMKMFFDYYMAELQEQWQKTLPKFVAKKLQGPLGLKGFKSALDLNVMITKKYTSPRYYQEINGIAKGSGISAKQIAQMNIFPEFIKAACTVAGLWGNATLQGKTLHMRALDWDYKNPMNKYPTAVIYHPSNKKWNPHANFAWAGFVGSITGMSNKISVGQKVWIPPVGTMVTTRYGNPWNYVIRDILYDAQHLEGALNIVQKAHRTCTIHLGIGSAVDKSFRMLDYSYQILNIYDDKNYTHYGANHPQLPGVAYFDKHVQPSKDSQVGLVLSSENLYGKWQMQNFWRTLGLTHRTGDTQLVVFNLADQQVLISYSQYNGTKKAYERSPIYLNMAKLFADFE